MIIHINNISKSLNNKNIISNISFAVDKGKIVALIGPNGSGKTTLFKLMSSLITLDKGSITMNGVDLSPVQNITYLKQLSFMQDLSVLDNNLSGYDHLKFISAIHNKNKQDVNKIIQELDLESYIYKRIHTYSLGMKQFLLLGLSLISDSPILLLDEPLNGLDPLSVEKFYSIILNLKDQGTTIIFSSHNLSSVERIADSIIFIREGEIIRNLNLEKDIDVYEFNSTSLEQLLILLENNPHIMNIKTVSSQKTILTIKKDHLNMVLKEIYSSSIEISSVIKQENIIENIYKVIYGGVK